MLNVAHVTSAHPSDDIRINQKECSVLAAAGYDVSLVAVETDSPRSGSSEVKVHALPREERRARRMVIGSARAIWRAFRLRADVYHIHDPELLPLSLLLKATGAKVIYDAHEDLAASLRGRMYLHPLIRSAVAICAGSIERTIARVLDGVVAATPSIARRFPASRTTVVQNFPIVDEGDHMGEEIRKLGSPAIVYVGGISQGRGIMEMLSAFRIVRERIPESRFRIAGGASSREVQDHLNRLGDWERVEFYGWLSRHDMFQVMAESHVGLVLFQPLPNHVEAQPNKLFEYMERGLPVVASDFPRWRQIVEGEDCGLLVDPNDVRAVADAIDWLLTHPVEAAAMGERGRDAVRRRYSWAQESKKLLEFYGRFCNDSTESGWVKGTVGS